MSTPTDSLGRWLDDNLRNLDQRIRRLEETSPALASKEMGDSLHEANLAALAQHTNPDAWNIEVADPLARHQVRTMLSFIHGLILQAQAGLPVEPGPPGGEPLVQP